MEGITFLQLIIVASYGLEWKLSALMAPPVIKLELTDSCRSEAQFEWLIFEEDSGLADCTILYDVSERFSSNSSKDLERYSKLQNSGTFRIRDLVLGHNYSVEIICKKAISDVLSFSIEDKDCASIDNQGTTSDTPVVFKEQTSLLWTRDSVLGIVFALFGLLIIIVTTFYIVQKIRRRQRLERIRRYLGSSLIDPFENMQDREQENGSERLIDSTDS